MMELAYITGNETKFNEAKQILGDIVWVKVDLPEIQSLDPKEVIMAKVKEATRYRETFIVEDVSLHLNCIKGLPGPFVKWFLSAIGTEGIYELVNKYGDYRAQVTCSVCYSAGENELFFFEGTVKGEIVKPDSNSNFSWNSLFKPLGSKNALSVLASAEGNKISPRGIALKKLLEFLRTRTK